MELPTITMPRQQAREAFLDYRRAVRSRHDDEDAQIMRGYRALAQGHQLIRLSEAVVAGGETELTYARGRGAYRHDEALSVPLLAVARADATMVWTRGIDEDGLVEMVTKRDLAESNRRDRYVCRAFPAATRAGGGHVSSWDRPVVRAVVPNVPPPLRPADKLGNYHVLFEAEWGVDPEPPVDPALLKHIGGDLYAVVAVWDLTEVERAVLALRG